MNAPQLYEGILKVGNRNNKKLTETFLLIRCSFFSPLFLLYSLSLSVTVRTLLFPWPAAGSPEALKAKTKPWECPLHSLDNSAGAPA